MTISSNLASGARRALRAAAHHLDPVVMIGDRGLTASVLHEIDIALTAHALIKVRVASDQREQRVAFMDEICAKLGCESVQHLGKLLVLWRNREDGSGVEEYVEESTAPSAADSTRGPRKKLADGAMRRPTERDPRPREGQGRGRESAYGARKPATGGSYARGSARGTDRGEGYAPRGAGGYSRDNESSYKPRSGGFGRGGDSGYNARGGGEGSARPRPSADGYGRSDGTNAGAENRRFRRGDDAPAPDTRPPREGWAPRNRRGEGRNDTSGGFGGGAAPRSRTGGGNFSGGSGGDARPPRSARAPASEGRWGARGGNSSGNSPAPKPRARRRLG